MLRSVILNCRKLQSFRALGSKYGPNIFNAPRKLHTTAVDSAKLYVDVENSYAYSIIETENSYVTPGAPTISTEEAFNAYLNQNFRQQNATQIVSAFKSAAPYASSINAPLSDERFNRLTDGLMDNVEKLTDSEILELLDALLAFPQCESYQSHNYHDIWSALDDTCCARLYDWPTDFIFAVAERWYKLNLCRLGDFVLEALRKFERKPKRLSKDELVKVFFYMNVCRKRALEFEYESALEDKIDDMTVDEMAVIALGYFKTQNKIKIPLITSSMMRKIKETENVHEMSLSAIFKVIRFSAHTSLSDQIYDLLQHLTPQLKNMSTMCLLHAALLGTTLQILHKPSLKIAAQRIAENITNVADVRLKDIERILLPLAMFDYDPKTTPDIFSAALNELQQEHRLQELIKHKRCLPCALQFLLIRGLFSYKLSDRVLDEEFIHETYGRADKLLPRELLSLDVSIQIECPDYQGNRLMKIKRHKCSKWLTEFTPTYYQHKKLSAANKVVMDVLEVCKGICGGEEFMYVDHVLPHFSRADVILCRDKSTKAFVKPTGFENYELGDVMYPDLKKNVDYFAVVIIGWNNTIRNTVLPVGNINMKFRQLEKIGYKPVPVIWNEYLPLNKEDKGKYILAKCK